MATIPPADAAPVPDQAVEGPGEGEGAPKKRFSLRLPAFMARLPKLTHIPMSKKLLIIIGSSVFALIAVSAAAIAFWPSEPAAAKKTLVAKKAKKPKGAASAASAASSAESAASAASAASAEPAASAAQPIEMAASAPADVVPHTAAASGPEDPMDRLQRRLGETLGGGGKLESSGPGELRVTARKSEPKAAVSTSRPALRGDASAHAVDARDKAHRTSDPNNARASAAHARAEIFDDHAAAPRSARMSAAALQHLHWSYDGLGGPESWGRLKPEFAKCSTGARQSPIDIRNGIQVHLDPIGFDYKPSAFRVIDNGHTVQVNVAPGNFIEVSGKRFHLQQFHFHRPSEERIDGRQFDMVAHLVHKNGDGKFAIVAVLLERGSAQTIVQTVWNNLPLEKGEEQAAQMPMDLNQLLPAERSYYTYMGSLTTPPCSEGVLWMVMKKPVPVAPEQIDIFARLYPMNARPIQSASGRMIKESN